MKFNPDIFKQLFKGLKSNVDDIASAGFKDLGSKQFADIDFPNATYDLSNLSDDIPKLETIPSSEIITDNFDKINFLGKATGSDMWGTGTYTDIVRDPQNSIDIPELNVEDLVFLKNPLNPSDVTVRPHTNTALSKWFENQHFEEPNVSSNLTSEDFIKNFLAERESKRFKLPWLK